MDVNKEEILEELRSVFLNKTFDALLPPLVYAVSNSIFGLLPAVILAVTTALFNFTRRLIKKENWKYSLGGLVGVIFASSLAYLSNNASSYFIPALTSSSLFLLTALITLLVGKPLAAWASHLSRGWPLAWFWRDDVKPAYREVTIFWAIYFGLRLTIQLNLFFSEAVLNLAWVNIILGWPAISVVLIISYIYGVWRLNNLGGPGVDEFKKEKEPPWDGQKRGF
ncbi:DUF3159 domain-containing protein [Halanaerobium sp. ST460_2HS_T2]|jgi:hypothetical protein|uniref:DUF3159 domain-containing protein n=1 Tax=Halanaerobium sp. ST460_2HS_T2 TaxID=2183914 RepID=UPI000DF119D5|nr:DUF3159 domain-containing protein [Halanaerobium sp. ST460_2HS_T2]RCW54889.1 uncharacterized protein DUF3159 [Halanaerobium sp. ST460_2HS_T2]